MEIANKVPFPLDKAIRRDSELWSITLILLSGFAAGLILFVYAGALIQKISTPGQDYVLDFLLVGLVSLILLLNVYLIGKKRAVHQMLRQGLREEEELHEQKMLGVTDALTGVYNRAYFNEVVPRELKRAARRKHGIALLLMNVDGFRRLNDEKGRSVGDYALRELTGIMKQSLRATDYLFRFGGDEFLAALVEIKAGAEAIVERRIHERLNANLAFQIELGQPLTLSIGTASFEVGQTVEALEKQVQVNLQAQKRKKLFQGPDTEPSKSSA